MVTPHCVKVRFFDREIKYKVKRKKEKVKSDKGIRNRNLESASRLIRPLA
jgi:hypothetical protein